LNQRKEIHSKEAPNALGEASGFDASKLMKLLDDNSESDSELSEDEFEALDEAQDSVSNALKDENDMLDALDSDGDDPAFAVSLTGKE